MALPIEFPSTTTTLSLPLLFSGQAQKEFFINQAFAVLDAMLQNGINASLSAPPAIAEEGACYRIANPASEEWTGREDDLAVRVGGSWHFVTPRQGMRVFDRETGVMLHFNAGWKSTTEPALPTGGASVDAEARQALSELIEALRMVGFFPPAE